MRSSDWCAPCRYPRFVGQKIAPDQLLLLSFPVSHCGACYRFEGFVEVRPLLGCINLCCGEDIWTTSPGRACVRACASSRTENKRFAGTNCLCHYVSISVVVGTICWVGTNTSVSPSLCLEDKTSAKEERQRFQKGLTCDHTAEKGRGSQRWRFWRGQQRMTSSRTCTQAASLHRPAFTLKEEKQGNGKFSEEGNKWPLSSDGCNQQDILALSSSGVNVLITASIQRWRNSLLGLWAELYNQAK